MKKILLSFSLGVTLLFSLANTKLLATTNSPEDCLTTEIINVHDTQNKKLDSTRSLQSLMHIWKLIKNFFKTGLASIEAGLEHLGEHLTPETSDEVGKVRQSNMLSEAEIAYLSKRAPFTKKAIEDLLGQPLDDNEVPTIAIAFTGGGYRAMVETVGFLAGAEKTGLLNATTYVTGLSGSTWALVPWTASNMSVDSYRRLLSGNLDDSFWSRLLFEAKEMPKIICMLAFKNYMINMLAWSMSMALP